MKQKLLLWMTALVVTVGIQAQRSYTFNVAAYNVDGLPETVNFLGINITTNAGAGGVSGATDMGEALQTENWEIGVFLKTSTTTKLWQLHLRTTIMQLHMAVRLALNLSYEVRQMDQVSWLLTKETIQSSLAKQEQHGPAITVKRIMVRTV